MIWNIITAVAALVSTFAYIITALYIRAELKGLEKDRYLNVTSELFSIWQSREFMTAQLWLLHRLEQTTWQEFVQAHRADVGEIAFHRVGSFYDRIGTLIRLGLVDEKEILPTLGGHAIAVWQKIEPLVREARRIENSVLFQDFERLLPSCYECYVPSLGQNARISPFTLSQPDKGQQERPPQPLDAAAPKSERRAASDASVRRISMANLKVRLAKGDPMTILDVRQPAQRAHDNRRLPGAVVMDPDEVERRFTELPLDRDVIVYCA